MDLFVEHIDGKVLTAEEQTGPVWRSNLRPATEEEIKKCTEYFNLHGRCKYHLVYDKPGFDFDLRYCGVCNSFVCLI